MPQLATNLPQPTTTCHKSATTCHKSATTCHKTATACYKLSQLATTCHNLPQLATTCKSCHSLPKLVINLPQIAITCYNKDVKYSSLSQQFMQFLEFMKKIILIYFEIRYLCQLAVCCNIGSFLSVVSVMSQILSTQLYKFSESLTFSNPLRLSYIISYEYRALVRTTRYQTETSFKCYKTYEFVLN